MPKQIRDIRKFLKLARKKSTQKIIIFTSKKNNVTKFKLRTPKSLITLKIRDPAKAQKIKNSFPPDKHREEIKGRRRKS